MRWLSYFILAYIAMGLQIGLSRHVQIGSAWPNFVLLAAIFIAINAPHDAALLGCLGLGIMQDMTTQNTLGLFALSYGFVAMFVVSTQQVVYRGHPLTHFSLAFIGMLMTGFFLLMHAWIRGPEKLSPMTVFYSALYTAVLAPILLGVLDRMKKAFSFQTPRRKIGFRV
jgi:rod shape-determining protein MreD